jgi:hypothetical protein
MAQNSSGLTKQTIWFHNNKLTGENQSVWQSTHIDWQDRAQTLTMTTPLLRLSTGLLTGVIDGSYRAQTWTAVDKQSILLHPWFRIQDSAHWIGQAIHLIEPNWQEKTVIQASKKPTDHLYLCFCRNTISCNEIAMATISLLTASPTRVVLHSPVQILSTL